MHLVLMKEVTNENCLYLSNLKIFLIWQYIFSFFFFVYKFGKSMLAYLDNNILQKMV